MLYDLSIDQCCDTTSSRDIIVEKLLTSCIYPWRERKRGKKHCDTTNNVILNCHTSRAVSFSNRTCDSFVNTVRFDTTLFPLLFSFLLSRFVSYKFNVRIKTRGIVYRITELFFRSLLSFLCFFSFCLFQVREVHKLLSDKNFLTS